MLYLIFNCFFFFFFNSLKTTRFENYLLVATSLSTLFSKIKNNRGSESSTTSSIAIRSTETSLEESTRVELHYEEYGYHFTKKRASLKFDERRRSRKRDAPPVRRKINLISLNREERSQKDDESF